MHSTFRSAFLKASQFEFAKFVKLAKRANFTRGAAFLVLGLSACRGQPFEDTQIHPQQNMYFQEKYMPQSENKFFADKRAMRPLVPGTIARGSLREDDAVYQGKVADKFVTTIPFPITQKFVERGQERYDIYCAVCHGRTGEANGIVVARGMLKPPSFNEERIVTMSSGEIYGAILNGVRGNMPSYAYAIPVEDRWAIVAYMRALQLSHRASLQDVPADIASEKGWIKK